MSIKYEHNFHFTEKKKSCCKVIYMASLSYFLKYLPIFQVNEMESCDLLHILIYIRVLI